MEGQDEEVLDHVESLPWELQFYKKKSLALRIICIMNLVPLTVHEETVRCLCANVYNLRLSDNLLLENVAQWYSMMCLKVSNFGRNYHNPSVDWFWFGQWFAKYWSKSLMGGHSFRPCTNPTRPLLLFSFYRQGHRHREIQWFVQGHTAGGWSRGDSWIWTNQPGSRVQALHDNTLQFFRSLILFRKILQHCRTSHISNICPAANRHLWCPQHREATG